MQVILAESAGFCYGVKRAVELAQKTAAETQGCWMLGDLIHNTHVVNDLAARGVAVVMNSSDMLEVIGMSSRVIVMYEGRISGVLEKEELTEERIMQLGMGLGKNRKEGEKG